MACKGHVSIIDDEGDPDASLWGADSLWDIKETVLVKEYDSKDAAILKLFFEKELQEITPIGLITCDPPNGPGLKLLIKCKRSKKEQIDTLVKDLDDKLQTIEEREVTVPSDAFAKLAEHMRSEEKRRINAQQKERVLYRPDIVKKIVQVFFWPGNDEAVRKLKEALIQLVPDSDITKSRTVDFAPEFADQLVAQAVNAAGQAFITAKNVFKTWQDKQRELGKIKTGGTRQRSATSDQAVASIQTTFSVYDSSSFEGSIRRELPNQDKQDDDYDERMDWKSRPASNWRSQHHGQGGNGGQGISQNHGSSHGQGHDSTLEELCYEDLGISCEVKKLQYETFKWGTVAQLFAFNRDLKVKIFKGDITKSSNIDALVCGIGTDMQFSGLVADALKTAGGFDFTNAVSKTIKSSKTGKPGNVMKSVSGKLKVTWVIFVVCDKLKDVDTKELSMYRECVFNLLKKANQWNVKKIAIPLFSTGYLQTNENKLQKCAIAFIQALDTFVDDRKGKTVNVKEILLENTSDLVTSTLVKVFDAASRTYGHNDSKPVSKTDVGRHTNERKYFEHGTETPSDGLPGVQAADAYLYKPTSLDSAKREMVSERPSGRPPVMCEDNSKREQCKQIVLSALGLKTWEDVEDSYDQADNMLQYTDDVSSSEGRLQFLARALELAKIGKTRWTVHITVKRNGVAIPVDKQLIDTHSSQIIKEMKKKP